MVSTGLGMFANLMPAGRSLKQLREGAAEVGLGSARSQSARCMVWGNHLEPSKQQPASTRLVAGWLELGAYVV